MAMKVVVVDGAQLPQGVDFPPLELDKYGWEQYPGLDGEDLEERCWRADIVVSLDTAISPANLEKMPKMKFLIAAGPAVSKVDQAALAQMGVELLAFPDARYDDVASAQDLCNRVSEAINHYLRNFHPQGVSS